MPNRDISLMDKIVKKAIEAIDNSRNAIFDIAEGAKKECGRLEEELKQLKIQATNCIDRVELLENNLQKSRQRLAILSRNYENTSQEELRAAYETADKYRIDLAVEREKEKFLIAKRNDLEIRLKESFITVEKAEMLVENVSTAMDILTKQLGEVNEKLEEVDKKKFLGFRVIKAQEEERSRVAREIHDGPAQIMSNIVLKAEVCEKLADVDILKLKEELKNLKGVVRDCLKDIRRIIYDLRPMSLDDLGLVTTITKYVENYKNETGINATINVFGKENSEIDSNKRLAIFRITQEALSNIKKHSKAKNASVKLEYTNSKIAVHISDDGKGFNPQQVKLDRDETSGGFGLFSMRERIELLDGEFTIDSEISRGTKIRATLPLKWVNYKKVTDIIIKGVI